MINTNKTLQEYTKLTQGELEKMEKDLSLSYEEYEKVCVARGLKNIQNGEFYSMEEVIKKLSNERSAIQIIK